MFVSDIRQISALFRLLNRYWFDLVFKLTVVPLVYILAYLVHIFDLNPDTGHFILTGKAELTSIENQPDNMAI